MKRPVLLLGGACLIVATAFFVVLNISGAVELLTAQVARRPELLLPCLALMCAAVVWYGLSWLLILRQLGVKGPGSSSLLRFFLLTWPARYIPGTVPYHATRVLMAERIGATRNTVLASIAYELILSVGSAAAIGLVGVTIGLGIGDSMGSLYVVGLLPLLMLPLFLHPAIFFSVTNRLLALARRQRFQAGQVLTARQIMVAFASYCVVHVLNGVAFYYCIVGLTGTSVSLLVAVGTFSLAAAIGVAAIFLPSGIGVREAAIVAVLSTSLSTEDALLVAATARAVSVVGDLLPFAGISLFSLLGKVLGRTRSVALSGERMVDHGRF